MKPTSDYAKYKDALLRGRNGQRRILRDVWLTMQPDGALRFTCDYYTGDGDFLLLTPDDVWTFTKPGHAMPYCSTTLYNRIQKLTRINIRSDRTKYRNRKQPVRVYVPQPGDSRYWWQWQSIPYTEGLQAKNGRILNPEIAQDFAKRLNHGRALEYKRAYRALHKLLRVAVRIGADNDWDETRWDVPTLGTVNWREPTITDAETVFRHGNAKYQGWRMRDDENARIEYRKKKAESGLKYFRAWLHEQEGTYDYIPVPTPN